jgi:RNA polymerase sigma factor (sigma-70 family)
MRCPVVDPSDDTPGAAPGPPAGRPGDATSDDGRAAEDASWVVAARGGDDEAFGRLFDRWFDPVYDVAWRIVHDRDTAAEVAQDVFLAAWQGLDGLAQPASFGGWVRRIARNRALNRLDRELRSVPDDEQAAAALDRSAPDVDLTAAMNEREQHDLVWAAARALGERDASLLDLHLRHGLGAPAIADELGVTANNAHQLLHRLKGKLAGAIRAWVLWRAGEGRCAGLDRAIAGAGLVSFGAEAVRVIDRHARACDGCAERQQLRLAPEALFAAMPVIAAPPLLKAEAAAALGQAGVPMAGSAAAAPAPGGGSGAPGSGAADGPEPGGTAEVQVGAAAGGTTARRVALVAVAVVVLLVVAGVAGLAASGGGDGDTAGAAGPTAGEESPASSAPGERGAGSVKPSPGSGSAKPAPAPPGDTTATTAVPRGPGTTAGSGTTAPTGDPAPPPPPEQPPPPPRDPDPPTIGGFRAAAGEQCGATPSERLVQLAWQSEGGESATISGPGGTSTHGASGTTTRCVPVPTGTFTLTVTGPGGTATATTSAG